MMKYLHPEECYKNARQRPKRGDLVRTPHDNVLKAQNGVSNRHMLVMVGLVGYNPRELELVYEA